MNMREYFKSQQKVRYVSGIGKDCIMIGIFRNKYGQLSCLTYSQLEEDFFSCERRRSRL